ncbi:hypothetical protein Clacol_006452 [Clathrus columnatus]|uniref:Phosducin domain-containing protein n=1 Tax=Clathrus columnatus TaxID=1419009 RepID=A0AAV5AC37_9AGAM|nr:hypothetical protein Clacol_006452 [Clathrus columnatus]
MSVNPYEDTEFNDALRKHGILPPREPTPPTPSPPSSPKLQEILEQASTSKLQELEDEAVDSETERIIAAYRRQRLAELQRTERTGRFGRVYPIGREDYTREVTDTSKEDIPGEPQIKGTGVVCILYKDGQPASVRLLDQINALATQYPSTKFVSIIGNKCIPNYADNLCPTIIVYRAGEVTRQTVSWGAEKERSLAELEALLILSLAITLPHKHGAPGDSDSGEDSDSLKRSSRQKQSLQKVAEDSDSDFDI